MSTTALVWFRRDLRVHDHPALTAAHRECDRVVPVFVLDARLLGGRFPSPNRAWFLHGCLAGLREALRERGADLVIREGRPEAELPALARECGATALYFASDVSPFAMARDRRVAGAVGVEVRRRPGLFVADVGALKPYAVFTPFHRAWQRLPRREVHGAPRSLRRRRVRPPTRVARLLRQWISSTGVDPVPSFRRMYNPMTQQRRHDPDGEYVRRWLPELRDVPLDKLAEPWTMSAEEQAGAYCAIGEDYPGPVVDHKVERRGAMARYGAVSGR